MIVNKKDSELSLVSHHKPFLCISDTCRLKSLTNQMWFSVVYSLIVNDTRHHSCQNVVDSRGAPQQILTTAMTRIVVDNTIHHAKPQLIRFLPQYQRNKIFVLTIETTDLKVHALHYANELLVCVRLSFKNFCKLA